MKHFFHKYVKKMNIRWEENTRALAKLMSDYDKLVSKMNGGNNGGNQK
jgi:hypothetical protein